jgi:hypothetical protein
VDDDGVVVGVDDGRVVVVDRPWPPADGEEDAGVEGAGPVVVVVDVDEEEDGAVGSGEESPAGAVVLVVVDGSVVEGSVVDGSVVEEGSVVIVDGSVVEGSTVDGSVVIVDGSGAGSVAGMVSVVVGSIPVPASVGEPVSATACAAGTHARATNNVVRARPRRRCVSNTRFSGISLERRCC